MDLEKLNDVIKIVTDSIKTEGYKYIEKVGIIDETIFDREPIKTIYYSNISSLIFIAIWGVFIFLAFKTLLKLYSNITIDKIYFYILKVIIVAIFSINSYYICNLVIKVNGNITIYLTSYLEEISESKIDYDFIEENVDNVENLFTKSSKLGIDGFSDYIICIHILIMFVLLSVRYVVILCCIIISPICVLFLLVEPLTKYYYLWLKVFTTNLLIQIFNTLIMYIPISSKVEKDIFICILIGSLILLYKVNKKAVEISIGKI